MYWITRLIALNDTLGIVFVTGCIILAVLSIGLFMACAEGGVDGDNAKKFANGWIKPVAIITAVALGISIFTPNKDDMVLIAGAELTKEAVTTPEAAMLREWVDKELSSQINKLADKATVVVEKAKAINGEKQ